VYYKVVDAFQQLVAPLEGSYVVGRSCRSTAGLGNIAADDVDNTLRRQNESSTFYILMLKSQL